MKTKNSSYANRLDIDNLTGVTSIANTEGDLEVVQPKENQLMLDIDTYDDYLFFYGQYPLVDKFIGIEDVNFTTSRSGGDKKHIYVTLKRSITPLERMGLQAMLGSDRTRELLSLIRYMKGDPNPTLFLEKK